MIRIHDLKMPVDSREDPIAFSARKLGVDPSDIERFALRRRSLDARKKDRILYVMTADLCLRDPSDERLLLKKRARSFDLSVLDETPYVFPYTAKGLSAEGRMSLRPVIAGFGPAGLFCAYELARAGYRPLVIERGAPVEERAASIDAFWNGDPLDPESNVCFGEGGAGAFSDGKLNSSANDPLKRSTHVLETFVRFGADEDILSWYRPHIGTDALRPIIRRMREEIVSLGGEVRFHSRLDEILTKESAFTEVSGIRVTDTVTGRAETIACDTLILAVGHSASDTFRMLKDAGVPIRQKPFAVGFRVQHPQSLIDAAQYGPSAHLLPPAEYRLQAKTSAGRSVYSFCMCPGGYVVDSSSERGQLCVNGMSYHDRAGENANSAIVVNIGPADFRSDDPLGGLICQKAFEVQAFRRAEGVIPVQRYGDLHRTVTGERVSEAADAEHTARVFAQAGVREICPEPMIRGRYAEADLSDILFPEITHAFIEGMDQFGRKIPGFNAPGVLLAGVESRTSSPVRVDRGDDGQSALKGLFPCGEGAGYAGGIMSAAVDGIITAERAAGKMDVSRDLR
ncbi:MAG: FAD-dependent oxidoreductase [Lachnospiraceae bacterium]|nr:FAD-dependent oxidoreductase [Lachnospiraceae bacterium]